MIDQNIFRNALGHFATGVCIVTVKPAEGEAIGMTINSFSSVSLEPPLILWSIRNDSDCFQAFSTTDTFGISVLSSQQEDFSSLYAKRGQHDMCPTHYHAGATGAPLLTDALAHFECRVWARYPGGDHQIIVGEVQQLHPPCEGEPLLFHQGRYARIA